ncbi:MAG: glycosyltransferase [Candidatus Gastranaerophilales bacterium]|nr:glycosyltransferase [Candidatus Gastranaerophilales bacterium]
MKKVIWPLQYFHNPIIKKPIEEIWDDIDAYTFEAQYENPQKAEEFDFVVVLPPLKYQGKITKGVFFSQAVDVIIERFPKLTEIFIPIANSMFSSYPHSTHAQAFFTCYENKAKENYYKNKYPDKKDIVMLPLQDADFTHEYKMAPTFNTPKTTDIFCVTTAFPPKNIPVFAMALKAYEKKYGKTLKVKYAIGARDLIVNEDKTIDCSKLRDDARAELEHAMEVLGDYTKYIEFIPYVDYKDLPKYYTEAKCCVLASLLEGKNRFISEAMSCNTPIVVFKDFNQYTRGDYPIFFGNSGEYARLFNPEALADAIYKVINNPNDYEPRKNYLKHSGRKNFVNTIIDLIPYYKENLPEYEKGRITDNIWVDLAMQDNYQLSTYDFIYGRNIAIQHVRGISKIESLVNFFYSRFKIND